MPFVKEVVKEIREDKTGGAGIDTSTLTLELLDEASPHVPVSVVPVSLGGAKRESNKGIRDIAVKPHKSLQPRYRQTTNAKKRVGK